MIKITAWILRGKEKNVELGYKAYSVFVCVCVYVCVCVCVPSLDGLDWRTSRQEM
jgi:hypothetical protein